MRTFDILILVAKSIPLLSIIPWAWIALRLANTHGDFLVKHFSKSKGLRLIQVDMYRGSYRKIQTIGGIGQAIALSRSAVKNGLLDPTELDTLPAPLRRKLKWIGVTSLAIVSIMFLGGSVVIYREWF